MSDQEMYKDIEGVNTGILDKKHVETLHIINRASESKRTPADLAQKTEITKRGFRKRASKLEEKDLIRQINRGDGNSRTYLELTEKGKKKYKKYEPILINSEELNEKISRFEKYFLRNPTHEELELFIGHRVNKGDLEKIVEYSKPSEEIIRRKDAIICAFLYLIYTDAAHHYGVLEDGEIPEMDLSFMPQLDYCKISTEDITDFIVENPFLVIAVREEQLKRREVVDPFGEGQHLEYELIGPYKENFKARFGRDSIYLEIKDDEDVSNELIGETLPDDLGNMKPKVAELLLKQLTGEFKQG